jgi:hypothetical protein
LQADYADRLGEVQRDQPAVGTNRIISYAEVIDIKEITDRVWLKMLAKYHIWNESYVNARMDYNPRKPMNVILLRIFKLDRPILIDNKPEWVGCRSWIPLDIDVSGKPIMDDVKFNKIACEVKEVLSIAV